MEKEKVFIATDRETLFEVISEIMSQKAEVKTIPEFQKDRLSKPQAAKLIGISIPTLDKQIALGKFKQYNIGKRKYFLKSEITEALRKNS
jgi:predicted DNA-binding transcriptional regulator AlpA